jgi:hypothetical protein
VFRLGTFAAVLALVVISWAGALGAVAGVMPAASTLLSFSVGLGNLGRRTICAFTLGWLLGAPARAVEDK